MENRKNEKSSLISELNNLKKEGVVFCVDGEQFNSENELAELILKEDQCTYMRNYCFEDGKVTKIEFDKVNLV